MVMGMNVSRVLRILCASGACTVYAVAFADTTWKDCIDGKWSDGDKWDNGVPSSDTDIALFNHDTVVNPGDNYAAGDDYLVIHGADNFNKLTKSDIIRLCIEEMGLTPDQCVMVGDSDNDAIGADGIGCPFIGVTYGFGFENKEDVMEFKNIGVASTPEEIFDIITGQKI